MVADGLTSPVPDRIPAPAILLLPDYFLSGGSAELTDLTFLKPTV